MELNKSNGNSGIRFDGTQDKVQVFDPYKSVWRDWQSSGQIILPSTITVTTSSLDGEAVTATIEDESYTTTFVNGVAVFKVYSAGTVTITCGEHSTTVEVTGASEELEASLESVIWIRQNGEYKNGCSYDAQYNLNIPINRTLTRGKNVYANVVGFYGALMFENRTDTITRDLYKNTSSATTEIITAIPKDYAYDSILIRCYNKNSGAILNFLAGDAWID